MNLSTLNDLRQVKETEQEGTKLREFYAIGESGIGGSRGHLLFVQEVISSERGLAPGSLYTCVVACGAHVQGVIVPGWDLKDLTCAKCEKILARIKANLRKPKVR